MSFTIELGLRRSERSLERLLGLVGRRGYEVVGLEACLTAHGGELAVRMTLASDRPMEPLLHHIRKLHEVLEIRSS